MAIKAKELAQQLGVSPATVSLLLNNKIQGTGVMSPEQAVDPDAFFELLDGFTGAQGCGLTVTCESGI